jgi:capsular exopolysaccharide synthesis family protein
MSLSDVLSVLWHRKLVVVLVTALAIGGAVGVLRLVTPVYESTSTVALRPQNLGNDLLFFQTIDAIVPIYASAADSRTTLAEARADNNGELADISVRTFQATPIFKIDARGTDKRLVQESAQAVTDVLEKHADSGAVGIPSLRLTQIDRPSFPASPVFPNTKLTFAVAALLGLALGIAAALLQENLTKRVRTREELADASGLSIYAELPRERAVGRAISSELLTSSPALRTINEALRDLRTNLAFTGNGDFDTIAVTSPEGSHGKTTVAFGLAVAIARSGSKTLLVDADLRRGRIAELLDIPRAPGLHEALSGVPLADSGVLRRTALPNLDVVTGGQLESDPGELLALRFPEVLEQLRSWYDTIVIDTTPLVPVNDARVVASLASATLLVASAGASRGAVTDAVNRLSLISVTPTAAVLNKSRSRQARAYYGARPQAVEAAAGRERA